ncbi:RELT-like protein 1 isoform 1-T3 [Clarias gariepinus]|uniref:RELT-like protein 1 n=1 Tax=Clarias gariepinus TaxID=13013 RepID=UPI00234D24C0|nr:RELT-like protein 1 [Clarias gariepinus]XP_053354548.1 RELT-like protein 1 [Clarias gariepinus]
MADTAVDHSTAQNKTGEHVTHPEYIAFGLVPVFFILGLLGMFICHILKKKGYRCTTDAEDPDEPEAEEENNLEDKDMNDTYSEGNTDTVGQIVHFIMSNEANTDALKAMVAQNSMDSDGAPVTPTTPAPATPVSPGTPVSPVSPGAPPAAAKHTCNHLHTIGGVVGHNNMCNRCNQKKWPLVRRGSNRKLERRAHAGEVTVLAVGRFRVTKTDPRPARERRSLLITEPNGSVPATPLKTEPASPNSSTDAQHSSKAEAGDKKVVV